MAGPVWRFDPERKGICDRCLRRSTGMFVEGEVAENTLEPMRLICPDCISRTNGLVVSGEAGGHARSP
ncbi:MAG TPA: hypothetical protein VMT45_10800, partial [Thermoanaerobaculaceae bacterium]|nr:hypothetical protein [Thermoanaerobaculaceae bacterium]